MDKRIVNALLAQYDTLVTSLCCSCCTKNYKSAQRADLEKELHLAKTSEYLRVEFRFDVTGSDYQEDDSDVPLIGDAVEIVVVDAKTDKDVCSWDGHLKEKYRAKP